MVETNLSWKCYSAKGKIQPLCRHQKQADQREPNQLAEAIIQSKSSGMINDIKARLSDAEQTIHEQVDIKAAIYKKVTDNKIRSIELLLFMKSLNIFNNHIK